MWGHKRRRMMRLILWKRGHQHCAYCGRPLSFKETTLDHIVPTSKGGPNVLANVQIACQGCNSDKADKTDYVGLLERNYAEIQRR